MMENFLVNNGSVCASKGFLLTILTTRFCHKIMRGFAKSRPVARDGPAAGRPEGFENNLHRSIMKVLYCAIGFCKETNEQRMKTFLSEQHATNRNKDSND